MNNLLFKTVKGNQVNIPKLYQGAIQSGNANDPKNIGRITRKSSLFFLTIMMKIRKLWNQFIWRNSLKIGKAIYFLGLSGIILTIH